MVQSDARQPSADNPATEHVERWRDNRIGWSQGAGDEGATHYRDDHWGNRIEARHGDGSTTALRYDGLHQLRHVLQIDPQGQVQSNTTYRYDAFGRRVSKTHQPTGQHSQTTHYGWDGDRLVHTQSHGQIHHTVYEPGSFVPLLQIERHKDGQTNSVDTLLALAGKGDSAQELQRHDREMLHQSLTEVLQPGYQLSALLPQDMRSQVQESLQLLKKAQAHTEDAHPLTIRHFVTDHLGTPIALVNANGQEAGQVSWTARYGAWGEIEQEYNPHSIHQPIRLQGQQLDAETGLHYNRFRYYDPGVGQYVSQDPIGLRGGFHAYRYTNQPLKLIDPKGLEAQIVGHSAAGPVSRLTNPDSYHLAIQLTPDDKNCDLGGTSTLGGQPSGNFANGNLKSAPNYPGDSKGIVSRQIIPRPEGMSDCEFLKKPKEASKEYCNCLPYSKPSISPIPGSIDGKMDPGKYNSNSYVSGIIQRAGGVPPSLETGGQWQAPGYANPLPITNIIAPVGKVYMQP